MTNYIISGKLKGLVLQMH